jgi:hypothetical protein
MGVSTAARPTSIQMLRADAFDNVAALSSAGLVTMARRRLARTPARRGADRNGGGGVDGASAGRALAAHLAERVGVDAGAVDYLTFPVEFSTVDLTESPPLELARYVNEIPPVDPTFRRRGTRLDAAWDALLAEAQPAEVELDPARQAELAEAEELLFADAEQTPSGVYVRYQELLAQWLDAAAGVALAREEGGEQAVEVAAARERAAADALRAEGRQDDVERALSVIRRLGRHGPVDTFVRARQRRADSPGLTDADDLSIVPETGFTPDLHNIGWSPIVLDADQLAAGASVLGPLADVDHEGGMLGHIDEHDVKEVRASFAYLTVNRPWLEPSIFASRAWRLPAGAAPFSDGEVPPEGRLPAFIAGLVLLKDVRTTRLVPVEERVPAERAATRERTGRRTRRRRSTVVRVRAAARTVRARVGDAARAVRARVRDRRTPGRARDHRSSGRVRDHRSTRSPATTIRTRLEPTEQIGHEEPTIVAVACLTVPRCPDPDPLLFPTKEEA